MELHDEMQMTVDGIGAQLSAGQEAALAVLLHVAS